MADRQYDVPKKIQRLFEEKQKIKEAIRQSVLKRETCPYAQPKNVIDPAIIRFHAMLTYRIEHARFTPMNVGSFVGFIVIPFLALLTYRINLEEKREKLYRSGTVAYKDRFHHAYL